MVSWSLRKSIVALACLSGGLAANIQDPDLTLPSDASEHRQNVKDIFLTSWNAYMQVAFLTEVLCERSETSLRDTGSTLTPTMTSPQFQRAGPMVGTAGAHRLWMRLPHS